MNNLRFKIGIKEIVYVVLLFVIIRMIPPEASDLGALVLTVGAVLLCMVWKIVFGAVPWSMVIRDYWEENISESIIERIIEILK